jgi:hypothetical protein
MEDEGELVETVTAARKVLVSYDVNDRWRRECMQVGHFVFGRAVTVRLKGRRKRYIYPGLIARKGIERLGQSVFIMRKKDAEDLTHLLKKLRVPFREEVVWVRF